MQSSTIIVGIAGGTASGKTTLVEEILLHFKDTLISVIQHDSYYKDNAQDENQKSRGGGYDHPDALDTKLLLSHIEALRNGEIVQVPVWDFKTHRRLAETQPVRPSKIVIVEGILVLVEESLRNLMDLKIFVDTEPDIRLARRIVRDVKTRGRTFESVIKQYVDSVRPMHLRFVEPSKHFADFSVNGADRESAVELVVANIVHLLNKSK